MPRALDKVQKHVRKKRIGKSKGLHENSRDAQRLRRAGVREDRLTKVLNAAARANLVYANRVAWFRDAIEGTVEPLTEEELHTLTFTHISREDEELAEIQMQKRPGRPPSNREEQIAQRRDREMREYRAGFWIPDLLNDAGRSKLESWSGDWAGLNSLNFVRLVENGGVRPSSFPPKSLS